MSIFTQLLNFFSITYQYVKDRLPSTTKLYCWDIDEILRGLWCSLSQQGYWYIIDHTLILITNWEDVGVLHDQTPLQQGIERTLIKYWYWWKFEKTFLGSIHGQEGDRDLKEAFCKKNPCPVVYNTALNFIAISNDFRFTWGFIYLDKIATSKSIGFTICSQAKE